MRAGGRAAHSLPPSRNASRFGRCAVQNCGFQDGPRDEDERELSWVAGGTHRTSIMRASEDARRARSFSRAGGSTGTAVFPLALPLAAAADDTESLGRSCCCCCCNSAEWIADCGELSEIGRAHV